MSYVDPTATVGSAWCWWPLNISFDHQDFIKSDRISNTIVVFWFKIHLVPLILGDHCLCRKTIQIHQESSTRGKWSKAGPLEATWLGRPTPPSMAQHGPTSATSPIHGSGQETCSQAHATVGCKSVQDQRLKRGITWILGPTMAMSVIKWTWELHTHTLYYLRTTMQKGQGPHHSGGHPTWGRRPTPQFHQNASNFRTCKQAQNGAILCVDLRRFDPMAMRCSPMDSWAHLGVAPTPPLHYK